MTTSSGATGFCKNVHCQHANNEHKIKPCAAPGCLVRWKRYQVASGCNGVYYSMSFLSDEPQPPPFRQCPKDFETMKEERGQNDEEEGEEGREREDRAQAEGVEIIGSKESRTQKTSEKTVDERRVFTIPKPPVLRRLQIEDASRTNGR